MKDVGPVADDELGGLQLSADSERLVDGVAGPRQAMAGRAHRQTVAAYQRLGHVLWKQWSGYHRRSLVETNRQGFKRLVERAMARTFERQVVALPVRAWLG